MQTCGQLSNLLAAYSVFVIATYPVTIILLRVVTIDNDANNFVFRFY